MQSRQQHQLEVQAFLQKQFSSHSWELTLPKGHGNETYLAYGNGRTYFIKLGAQVAIYQAMASIGLTPHALATGFLEDGTTLLVQPYIAGRMPSRNDYRNLLEQIAMIIHQTHHSPEVKRLLPQVASDLYSIAGLEALTRVQHRWADIKAQVPSSADFVDESLAQLARQVEGFHGAGRVASHNDICNANWLIASNGQIYLIDLESMSLDDPACDIGATLWWYYPYELRQRFLEIVGYANDEQFQKRMWVRMALHCLSITLPRQQSFDTFYPSTFAESLTDFRAILAGGENPQGYEG